MSQEKSTASRPFKGVSTLLASRGGRRFLARIRHKGVEAHLGIYESSGLAGFAYNVACEALGRGSRPPNEIPRDEQPDPDSVRRIVERVRRRLGLDPPPPRRPVEVPPDPESLLTLFEVTVVGFWRDQAAQSDPGAGVDAAARRLADSSRLVFWSPSSGHPSPTDAIARLVSRRLDHAFRRSDLARAILDDDGDEDWRVARWLVLPDVHPLGRGFRDEVRALYADLFEGESIPHSGPGVPHWSDLLGVDPPFHIDKIRDAYRSRSKKAHPDVGGSHAEFVRLQAAYEEAVEYCRIRQG